MGLVHDQQGLRIRADLGQLAERSAVSVHGEDGVGDDELATRRRPQQAGDRADIAVRVDLDARPGKAATVDDRGVVQGIREDQVLGAGERGEEAAIGGVAAAEEDCCLGAFEPGELRLQLVLRQEVATDQPARACPGAPRARSTGERLDDAGVRSEPEVVVGAEVDQPLPGTQLDLGPRRGPQRLHRPQ